MVTTGIGFVEHDAGGSSMTKLAGLEQVIQLDRVYWVRENMRVCLGVDRRSVAVQNIHLVVLKGDGVVVE